MIWRFVDAVEFFCRFVGWLAGAIAWLIEMSLLLGLLIVGFWIFIVPMWALILSLSSK